MVAYRPCVTNRSDPGGSLCVLHAGSLRLIDATGLRPYHQLPAMACAEPSPLSHAEAPLGMADPSALEPAGPAAASIDGLWRLMLILTASMKNRSVKIWDTSTSDPGAAAPWRASGCTPKLCIKIARFAIEFTRKPA
jgi:hypothetical protein